MAYTHGVKVSEVPTSILPPVEVSAGIPFIVGTAPVNMTDTTNVNQPKLCFTYDEAVKAFGYVPPVENPATGLKEYAYSISEFIHSHFALFGVSPVMIVNVLKPDTHQTTTTTKTVTLDPKTGSATIAEAGIVPATVSVSASSGSAYVRGTDYETAFDDDGFLVITSLKDEDGAFKCTTGTALTFTGNKLNPAAVDAEDVIGGVDVDGNKSGFELVNECFARFRKVPSILLAPGYSQNAGVAAVMAAKAANINELFTAGVALVDVPTDTCKQYAEVPAWKNANNLTDTRQ
ncbi:MAG: phage tail sheath family protein, partial [Candidatus Spyradenecus sp.]